MTAPFIIFPNDWPGWALVFICFGIVPLSREPRENPTILGVIWFTIFCRFVVAFLYSYWGALIGARGDWMEFHYSALERVRNNSITMDSGSGFYKSFLAFFYKYTEPSFFLAHILSIFPFALSCLVMLRFFRLLHITRYREGVLLIFGLLPSALFFGSVPLRESWQTLLFMTTVYAALQIQERPAIARVLLFIMSGFLLSLFHQSWSLIVIGLVVSLPLFSSGKDQFVRSLILYYVPCGIFLISCIFAFTFMFGAGGAVPFLKVLYYRTPLEYLIEIRKYVAGDTAFNLTLHDKSGFDFLVTMVMIPFYYLFYPMFDFSRGSITSFYASAEGLLRFILLGLSFKCVGSLRGMLRRRTILLLGAYAIAVLVWSLGTGNYGTSLRHNQTHQWILYLTAGPALFIYFGVFVNKWVAAITNGWKKLSRRIPVRELHKGRN